MNISNMQICSIRFLMQSECKCLGKMIQSKKGVSTIPNGKKCIQC